LFLKKYIAMIIFGIFGITIIIQLTHDWVTKFNAKRITFY